MLADIDVKEKAIGKYTFYVRPFPPMTAIKLLGDLQAILTGALGEAVKKPPTGTDVSDEEVDIAVGAILSAVGKNLTGPRMAEYAERLLVEDYVSVRLDGEQEIERLTKANRDAIFTGHVANMVGAMMFVLEVNFADFFDELPSLIGKLKELKK